MAGRGLVLCTVVLLCTMAACAAPDTTSEPTPSSLPTSSGSDTATAEGPPSAGESVRPVASFPAQIFAPDSPFHRELPDDSPSAWNSDELVASLVRQSETYFGTSERPNLTVNHTNYAATMYVADSTDPIASFSTVNCQGKPPGWDDKLLSSELSGVRVPPEAVPDGSSDGPMVVYNSDTRQVTETWVTTKTGPSSYTVCWGGSIDDAAASAGVFDQGYGVSASGLAQAGYTIRLQELLDGEIRHMIGIGLPEVAKDIVSWPATRTDGRNDQPALAMGQILRLPADLDLDQLSLSPLARLVAEAAQTYGIVVVDTSGALSIYSQHEDSVPQAELYRKLMRGRSAHNEMAGDPARGEVAFPLGELEALPVSYHAPGDTTIGNR